MQGPYAFINDLAQPYSALKQRLSLNAPTQTKFDTLNQHIRNSVVLPGQLVIIPDPSTASCGSAAGAWSKHLAEIEKTLKDIDDLHKRYLSAGTTAPQEGLPSGRQQAT